MSRRSTSHSVSLFPFLAVLMCALGALILLLLVTAGRIRDEAVAKAHEAMQLALSVAEPPPLLEVAPEPVTPQPVPEPILLPAPGPTAEELRRDWEQTVADLEMRHARL